MEAMRAMWRRRCLPALPTLLFVLMASSACIHGKPKEEVTLEPVKVTGTHDSIDELLASMNDEELFTKGESSYAAGQAKLVQAQQPEKTKDEKDQLEKAANTEFTIASRAFGRILDDFPKSKHYGAAAYNGGLALEALGQWQPAYERYFTLLDIEHGTPDQIDAGFRAARCLYELDKYADAIALLQRILSRTDLSENLHLAAETQIGICQLESADLTTAEATLRHAVARFEASESNGQERLDDYYGGQAQFYLGELYRTYFEQVTLDPNKEGGIEKLGQDLEYKAEMLLSAQGHYLRAMRIGNATWATAAGTRVGELYESMYDSMMVSPAPNELEADQQKLYRDELHKKIRVLVSKAISIYERTLEAAERTGTNGPFIDAARERLERMKNVLIADAKAEGDTNFDANGGGDTATDGTDPASTTAAPDANPKSTPPTPTPSKGKQKNKKHPPSGMLERKHDRTIGQQAASLEGVRTAS
jgi:tetratricopeptide (TPR) repeat protein